MVEAKTEIDIAVGLAEKREMIRILTEQVKSVCIFSLCSSFKYYDRKGDEYFSVYGDLCIIFTAINLKREESSMVKVLKCLLAHGR